MSDQDVIDHNSVPTEFIVRDKAAEALELRAQVYHLIALLDIKEVPQDTVEILMKALEPYREVSFEEDFNVREELITQMQLVKAARNSVLDSKGAIEKSATISEVKSVLDVSMKLSTMLNAVNKELVNQERIQAIEAAFTEVVHTFEQEKQVEYVRLLERRLKLKKELQK